jgi:group II intron reverse transcriptase/maturase
MVRFTFRVVYLLVATLAEAALLLLGCAVRLVYWTVRTYGWGQVLKFAAAAWGALWLSAVLGAISPAPVAVFSLVLWAGISVGYRWARLTVDQWFVNRSIPAIRTASIGPQAPPSPLWEQATSLTTLQEAWQRVWLRGGGPGGDGMTVETFAVGLEGRLRRLQAELLAGCYRPLPPRRVDVPKPAGGLRQLAVLAVRDRVVQQAIYLTLAHLWDSRFAPCSYAYRPARSALRALGAVERGLAAGNLWVVDADIASFFDSVPHRPLFERLAEWLPEPRLFRLVEICVGATSPEPGRGLAQGAPLSPLLANLYLHSFDTAMVDAGYNLVRYADDFVVLCPTRQQAEHALRTAAGLLGGLGLRLKPEKTRIVHRDEGFVFLGYHFDRNGKRPADDAVCRLRLKLRLAADPELRRRILAGWQGYFGPLSEPEAGPATTGPGQGGDPPVPWTDASVSNPGGPNLEAYRRLFLGRPDVFARAWVRGGRRGYTPVRRAPSDEELRAHLIGETILGTYLLQPDGTTRALVVDIDGPGVTEDARRLALELASRLMAGFQDPAVCPLWFDSGGKGCHLWFCFATPQPAVSVRRWAGGWLDGLRPFPPGVCVEVFPKQDRLPAGALGSLIRLPLGRHPATGRLCRLLGPDGLPLADPWPVLVRTMGVDAARLIAAGDAGIPEPPEPIAPLVWGCNLIRGLAAKAARTRHLRHVERLALLYTLGYCGEPGRAYLHQVIGLCSNYDPRITERWIRRLSPKRRPIRCATLQAWLKDQLPGVACTCPKRGRASPLDLLPASPPAAEADPAWAGVMGDLFGEQA